MTSVSGGIEAPFSVDSWHGDKTGGRSLGVAKIAVKVEDFVLAVEFLTCGSQTGPISVSRNTCINPPEIVVNSPSLIQIFPRKLRIKKFTAKTVFKETGVSISLETEVQRRFLGQTPPPGKRVSTNAHLNTSFRISKSLYIQYPFQEILCWTA